MDNIKFVPKGTEPAEPVVTEVEVKLVRVFNGVTLRSGYMNIATLRDDGKLVIHRACHTEGVDVDSAGHVRYVFD